MASYRPASDDIRFTDEFYSRAEVARLVEVPTSTVSNWIRGYRYPVRGEVRSSKPLIVPPKRDHRWLSFANLVEAHTIAAFRASGVSMQKIRPALAYLAEHLEYEHPLASRDLLTDGAQLFFRFLKKEGEDELVALLNLSQGGQVVFDDVVEQYLRRVDWADDHYPARLWPAGRGEGVVVDPRRGFGRPVIDRRGVRVDAVLARLAAGEPRESVAADFGLELGEVTAAERFQPRTARRAA
jgi:uncharacterized protein (DUF433 family)